MSNAYVYSFSKRADGNMSFSSGETACTGENRCRFLTQTGIDYRALVMPRQVHGDTVALVGRGHCGRGAQASETGLADTDALLTRERNVPIGVMTADCLPIVIFDPGTPSVAIVHAGWRSSRAHIAAKTVALMREKFNAQPRTMRCMLGPAIRACCYTVGEEMIQIFPRALTQRENDFYLDLAAENICQLGESGVARENIFDTKLCTSCAQETFFSYRREGVSCGRMLSVVMLR